MATRLNNTQINTLCVFIVSFFSPFLGALLVLIQISKRKKSPVFFLALFMGVLSMYYYPIGDQYRWMYDVIEFRKQELHQAFDFSSIYIFRDFNLVSFLVFIFAKLGFTLEIIRCFFVTGCYLLLLNVFFKIDSRGFFSNRSSRYRFASFMLLFMSVPYFLICYGFRTGIGASIFSYGFYLTIFEKKKLGYFIITLAGFCHVFFFMWVAFLCFAFVLPNRTNKFVFVFGALCMLVVSSAFMDYFYDRNLFLNAIMDDYIYTTKSYENAYDTIVSIIAYWGLTAFVFYFVFFQKASGGVALNFLFIVFVSLSLFIPYQTLLQRSLASVIPLAAIYYVFNRESIHVPKIAAIAISFCLLFGFLTPFWRQRDMYRESHVEKVFVYPLPAYLFHTYENEARYKVDIDGSLKKY